MRNTIFLLPALLVVCNGAALPQDQISISVSRTAVIPTPPPYTPPPTPTSTVKSTSKSSIKSSTKSSIKSSSKSSTKPPTASSTKSATKTHYIRQVIAPITRDGGDPTITEINSYYSAPPIDTSIPGITLREANPQVLASASRTVLQSPTPDPQPTYWPWPWPPHPHPHPTSTTTEPVSTPAAPTLSRSTSYGDDPTTRTISWENPDTTPSGPVLTVPIDKRQVLGSPTRTVILPTSAPETTTGKPPGTYTSKTTKVPTVTLTSTAKPPTSTAKPTTSYKPTTTAKPTTSYKPTTTAKPTSTAKYTSSTAKPTSPTYVPRWGKRQVLGSPTRTVLEPTPPPPPHTSTEKPTGGYTSKPTTLTTKPSTTAKPTTTSKPSQPTYYAERRDTPRLAAGRRVAGAERRKER